MLLEIYLDAVMVLEASAMRSSNAEASKKLHGKKSRRCPDTKYPREDFRDEDEEDGNPAV